MATSSKFFNSNQVLRWLKRLKLGRSVLRVVLTLGSLRAMAMAAKSPKRVCSQSHLEEHDGLRNRVAVYYKVLWASIGRMEKKTETTIQYTGVM